MKSMVATVIEYDKEKTTVEMADRKLRPFRTKLFYSVLKNKKKRFTKYVPAFPQEEMSSYAHPYLFNEGKSLLFTSDMPGGYGGSTCMLFIGMTRPGHGNPCKSGTRCQHGR